LAPELLGTLEDGGLIDRCVAKGILVALGHHEGTDEAVKEAIRRGAKLCTHLGNGSRQVMPKFRGVIDEQLAEDGLMASFIADGHHVPFRTLQNFIRSKEVTRSILVTDATAAAEMAPGVYKLSGIRVTLKPDGRVVMPDGKKLAGSSLTLDRAIINVARNCGFTLEQAWEMASANPAKLFGGIARPIVTVDIDAGGFTLRPAGGN
jgi:N-acetylglucosamine-6-phosphate deacetylase